MSHLRWTSFRDIEDVLNRYNRVFGLQNQVQARADWLPTVDILENETQYLIQAELPAVPKEQVKVSVNERVLNISGERRSESANGNGEAAFKQRRSERSFGSFSRSFTLPEDADEAAIRAEYKDGVLSLHIPKAAKPQPTSIEVQVH